MAAFDDWRMAGRDAWLRQLHGLLAESAEQRAMISTPLAWRAPPIAMPSRGAGGAAAQVLLGDAAHRDEPAARAGA